MAFRKLKFVAAVAAFCSLAASAQAKVTIDFWDQVWGPQPYAQRAQQLVEEFNKSQSDIQVHYRSVPWANWYETYVTAIASGSAPDISTGAGFQAVQFYSLDAIYPLDDFVAKMKADGTANDFAPGALDAVKYDGHYVALPWGIDIRAMFYRKDVLEAAGVKPPTTWDEFRTASKAVTKNGVYGVSGSGDSGGMHWILGFMMNNGGGLFDKEGKPDLTGDKSMAAIQFLSDLVADGSVNPSSAGYKNDDARGNFYAGKSAFYFSNPTTADGAGQAKDKIGVLPPLASPSGEKGTINWVNNIDAFTGGRDKGNPAEPRR